MPRPPMAIASLHFGWRERRRTPIGIHVVTHETLAFMARSVALACSLDLNAVDECAIPRPSASDTLLLHTIMNSPDLATV